MAWGFKSSLLKDTNPGKYITNLAHRIQPPFELSTARTVALLAATTATLVLSVLYWKQKAIPSTKSTDDSTKAQKPSLDPHNHDPKATDPELLRNNSQIQSFTTSSGFAYSGVRVFYKPHTRIDELPTDPAPLPLLVFIHGLGGSAAQFHSLLISLTHNSSCLAVDLPGCGVSDLEPTSWEAYSNEALAELLETVIDNYRDKEAGQGVVLIGHSMGCALSARLASPGSSRLAEHVMGLIAICPPAGPPTEEQVRLFRRLLWIPTPVFNLWRMWDARGGAESASVKRFVGADADLESRQSQFRFNRQSRTHTWRRMAWGSLPVYKNGVPQGGIAGQDVWKSLNLPIFLIGGGKDKVTPAKEIEKIAGYLGVEVSVSQTGTALASQPIVDAAAPVDTTVATETPAGNIKNIKEEDFHRDKRHSPDSDDDNHEDPTTPQEQSVISLPAQPAHPKKVVKTFVVQRGTHACLYTEGCSRILASVIADFLSQHVTGRLSRAWQLQFLNKEPKWILKNELKWLGVVPVSESIAGVFRAMKTMRQVDDVHSPAKLVEKWGSVIKDVIDISKDTPVYDPASLEKGKIRYFKFATVSKIPPTDDEVDRFILLVDRLRKEQETRATEEGWGEGEHAVGVHCHYGYNRTGYFIVCYLIERCGFSVQQAIDAFAKARPKGIRHSHFKDQLFMRYSELRTQGAGA